MALYFKASYTVFRTIGSECNLKKLIDNRSTPPFSIQLNNYALFLDDI